MNVYVANTSRNGKGIFAAEDIRESSLIFIVEGLLRQQSYHPDLYMIGERWLGMGHELWMEPPEKNPMYYTNHSCQPTASIEDRIKVVAARFIRKDEEITFDYALTEEDPYWRMDCNCGSPGCRKIIYSCARF